MTEQQAMCPLFPDEPCPQGFEASEACQVRIASGFDPVADFRDFLMISCAVARAEQRNKEQQHDA